MIEQLLTEHLDTWTQAVETKSAAGRGSSKKLNLVGIKKLRELILELAVRGQLVPQNENDEPAEVLLARIAAERERLVKEKKIKKPKRLPEISDQNKPFELPSGWEWSYLQDLGIVASSSRVHKKDWVNKGIPFYRAREVVQLSKYGKVDNDLYITDQLFFDLSVKGVVPENTDLLITGVGTIGVPYIVKDTDKFYFKDASVLIFKNHHKLNPEYLSTYMRSPLWSDSIHKGSMGTTVHTLTISRANVVLVPLPPEDEQKRIVAKVDELMALCDALEREQESSIAAHEVLVENLLAALTNASNQGEFKQAWARVAEHFDTLFTTERSVDQLKQTILQLAVMGKLVEQDPTDEPAGVLLERIATEKARLVKEKKIKKQKALPEIGEEEKVFELPVGWEWCRFADLANEVATGPFGSMIHKRDYIESGVPLINPSHMINSVIVEDRSISVSKEKASELDSYELFTGDIVMARRGEMGRCALVSERENGWLCGTGSFVLRFQAELSRDYILLFFKTNWTKSYLGGKSIGTTMTNLNHGILNRMPVLLPPLGEQKRIVARVSELLVFCEQLKSNIEKAQSIQLSLSDALTDLAVG